MQALVGSASQPLSSTAFLARVQAADRLLVLLSSEAAEVARLHSQELNGLDTGVRAQLNEQLTSAQNRASEAREAVRELQIDLARTPSDEAAGRVKNAQVGRLRNDLRQRLEAFRKQEASYENAYREQIGRQFRTVKPDATEDEVHQAMNADWGNEGVFQSAVSSCDPRKTPPPRAPTR